MLETLAFGWLIGFDIIQPATAHGKTSENYGNLIRLFQSNVTVSGYQPPKYGIIMQRGLPNRQCLVLTKKKGEKIEMRSTCCSSSLTKVVNIN